MTAQRHQIRRQVLELELTDEGSARSIQRAATALYRQRLVPLIERCLDARGTPGRHDRLARVELDLGEIAAEHLEVELPRRLEAELVKALDVRLRARSRARPREGGWGEGPPAGDVRSGDRFGGPEEDTSHPNPLPVNGAAAAPDSTAAPGRGATALEHPETARELLEVFVRTGRLPWWADTSVPAIVDRALDHVLGQTPPPALASWLRRLASRPGGGLARLVRASADPRLAALVDRLLATGAAGLSAVPADAAWLIAALRSRPSPAVAPARFRHALWEALLHLVLLAAPGDPETLWRAVLTRLAAALDQERGELARALDQALEVASAEASGGPSPPPTPRRLRAIVAAEARTSAPPAPRESRPSPETEVANAPAPVGELAAIRQLLDGLRKMPDVPHPTPGRRALVTLLSGLRPHVDPLPAAHHRRWLEALRQLLRDDGSLRAAAELARPAAALTALYAPLLEARRLSPRWLADTAELVRRAADAHPADADAFAALASQLSTADPTSTASQEARQPGALPHDPDLSFSDVDVAYVENAGLVLLWPFLGHFFSHLGLMSDGRTFHDEASRHRAAGLLQYVAVPESEPPEYLVTLNKLLCGLQLEEVFVFGPPVRDDEAEHCAGLLTAVIAQAPILKKMSIDGFRGSFLLRRGAVTAEGNAWLLRVERETWDVVIEQFPWSLGWLSLPWMQEPIRVEW